MSITYQCDKCGKFVNTINDLHRTEMNVSGYAYDEWNPVITFWVGDLCDDCFSELDTRKMNATAVAGHDFICGRSDGCAEQAKEIRRLHYEKKKLGDDDDELHRG